MADDAECDIPVPCPSEIELLKDNEPQDDAFVICNGAHHGASSWKDEMSVSCLFSFKIPKDASRECRMKILQALFSTMAERVDNAFGLIHTHDYIQTLSFALKEKNTTLTRVEL